MFTAPYHRINAAQLSINHEAIQVYNKIPERLKIMDKRKMKNEIKKILAQKAYYSMEEYWSDQFW